MGLRKVKQLAHDQMYNKWWRADLNPGLCDCDARSISPVSWFFCICPSWGSSALRILCMGVFTVKGQLCSRERAQPGPSPGSTAQLPPQFLLQTNPNMVGELSREGPHSPVQSGQVSNQQASLTYQSKTTLQMDACAQFSIYNWCVWTGEKTQALKLKVPVKNWEYRAPQGKWAICVLLMSLWSFPCSLLHVIFPFLSPKSQDPSKSISKMQLVSVMYTNASLMYILINWASG